MTRGISAVASDNINPFDNLNRSPDSKKYRNSVRVKKPKAKEFKLKQIKKQETDFFANDAAAAVRESFGEDGEVNALVPDNSADGSKEKS